MANDLVPFGSGQVPAYLQAMVDELGSNIKGRSALNALGTENSTWTVSIEGTKETLMDVTADGDEVPKPILRVVLLDYNQRSGRKFFKGAYVQGVSQQPACHSPDGILPDPSSAEKQAESCATCPRSVKGSKVEGGKAGTECSQHKMCVVALYKQPNVPPLRLQLSQTGDFDTRSPESTADKWFALRQYEAYFKGGGAKHSAQVLTKLRFNPKNTGPQVQFQVERWLNPAELAYYTQFIKDNKEEIANLLSPKFTPAGADGVEAAAPMIPPAIDEPDEDGPAAPAPTPPTPPAPAPVNVRRTAKPKTTPAAAQTTATATYTPPVPDFLATPTPEPALQGEVIAPAATGRSVLDALARAEGSNPDPVAAAKAMYEKALADAAAAAAAAAAAPKAAAPAPAQAPAPAPAAPAKPAAAPAATQPVSAGVAKLMEDWGN